jgi:hypothetical protein
MPYTFNGFGTRYYGERERAEDGSYITTEWITLLYFPILPIRSFRVLPVGKGTNIIIHSSQEYQAIRVPLCWPQVRNVYLVMSPVLLLFLYFGRSDIKTWVMDDVLKSSTPQSTLQPEPTQTQPTEADLPLNSKDAALACGKVLKLDKVAFEKLDLHGHLSAIVHDSGFSEEEFKDISSPDELENDAFEAYSLAYLTWDKPTVVSRSSLDKLVVAATGSEAQKLSPEEKVLFDAYMAKDKRMRLKAFDLGRHDARISPCPFGPTDAPSTR